MVIKYNDSSNDWGLRALQSYNDDISNDSQ